MNRKSLNYLSYYKHNSLNKMRIVFNILFRPRRVYKAMLIFVSAVTLYVIVYHEEFAAPDRHITVHQELMRVQNRLKTLKNEEQIKESQFNPEFDSEIHGMKYILLWTPTVTPFNQIRKRGQIPFISNGCEHTNCYLTHRRRYLPDQRMFDAIVFSVAALKDLHKLPKDRSPSQKFVVASTEPSQIHPVINPLYDGYFNWTWTYRLNSDILWRKFKIYDFRKNVVGPKDDIKWLPYLPPIEGKLDTLLSSKKRAVVWIKTCCKCSSLYNLEQLKYISDLEMELGHYGLSLATFSNCIGYDSCGTIGECSEMIQQNYYFYLAFEDYFDEDYVTEILLFAVMNYAVPVVMGNANYSRFLPRGSYVDANKLTAKALAKVIEDSMGDFTVFREYFRWVPHYYYEPASLESEICNICTALNNQQKVRNISTYRNFRKTWNGETSVLISDFLLKVFESDDALKNILNKGNYSEIRKVFKKRHMPDPQDSVYIFDIERLNLTTTEGTFVIPYELTSDATIY